MKKQIFFYLLITLLYCLFSIRHVHALTIDSFSNDGEAGVNATGTSATTVTASTGSAGGFRTLFVNKTAGVGGGKLEASTSGDWFYHSQGAGGTKGRSVITWDGNADGATVNFSGLGGLNLLQDQSTGFILDTLSKDDNTATIRIFVYDASDPSGSKYSSATVDLGKPGISAKDYIPSKATPPTASEIIEPKLLFSNFVAGPNGGADFTNVGAIQLSIDGTVDEALDIDFNNFTTNGGCPQSPTVGEKVVDDCGVCRGNNVDKDQCGVCFGNNKNVDPCGVCNGDGTSCLQCETISNTSAIDALDDKIDEYIANVKFFLQGVIKANPAFAKAMKKEIKAIEVSLTKTITLLPAQTTACNQVCADIGINAKILADIEDLVEKLEPIANKIIFKIKPAPGGKCKGSVSECKKRQQAQTTKVRSFKSLVKRLEREANQLTDSFPGTQSICN